MALDILRKGYDLISVFIYSLNDLFFNMIRLYNLHFPQVKLYDIIKQLIWK